MKFDTVFRICCTCGSLRNLLDFHPSSLPATCTRHGLSPPASSVNAGLNQFLSERQRSNSGERRSVHAFGAEPCVHAAPTVADACKSLDGCTCSLEAVGCF